LSVVTLGNAPCDKCGAEPPYACKLVIDGQGVYSRCQECGRTVVQWMRQPRKTGEKTTDEWMKDPGTTTLSALCAKYGVTMEAIQEARIEAAGSIFEESGDEEEDVEARAESEARFVDTDENGE
jgi:hypothetical protein